MQTFVVTASVGVQSLLYASGSVIYYQSSSAVGSSDEGLIVTPLGGQTFEIEPGQTIELGRVFNNFNITSRFATPITSKLIIGNGRFANGRLLGTVQITDLLKNRVDAGQVFLYSENVISAFTGGRMVMQLENPVGSTKALYLENMFSIGWDGALLRATLSRGSVKVARKNKLSGPNSVGIIRTGGFAGPDPSVEYLFQFSGASQVVFSPTEAVFIGPGEIVAVETGNASTSIGSSTQIGLRWYEA